MTRNLIDEEMRYRLIRKIEANPQVSQRELARELGISLGKVNYCLKALIEVGLIKAGNFVRASNKRDYAYCLTAAGVKEKAAMTRRFLETKQQQYDQLKREIEQLKKDIGSVDADKK
jgi:EPS-associated MarR family transcriptional regulator